MVVVVVVGLRNRHSLFHKTMSLCAQSEVRGESEWTKRVGAPLSKNKENGDITSLLLLWAGQSYDVRVEVFNATGPFLFWLDVYVVITDESTARARSAT